MMIQFAVGLLLLAYGDTAAVYVRGAEGTRYRGQVERIEVHVRAGDGLATRVAVQFFHRDGAFAFVAEGSSAPGLLSGQRKCDLAHYLYRSARGGWLEFRDQRRGKPVLPFSFVIQPAAVLPVCLDEQRQFAREATFLGDSFVLDESAVAGAAPVPDNVKEITLCDDVWVGTSRSFRDADSHRISRAEFNADPDLDYTYRAHDRQDLHRMLAAGFNYFDRVLPEQLEYLIDKPAWFDLAGFKGHKWAVFPEILFHPGFQGVEDFLDEPAYLFMQDYSPRADVTVEEMARLQEKRTRDEFERIVRGRQPGLMQLLREAGISLNGDGLSEPPFPIWEEFYDTGCYQLQVPVSGFIHEGRYQHPQTVDLLNYSLGTSLPRRPETMLAFYYGFLRGAARLFDKDWGMSIYGQADPAVSLLAMTMAYDRGARWIYFWSSDRHHHVPFEEQLLLARALSEHMAAHPRKARRELVRGADDAVVLPYGFTFSVSDWQKARLPGLWQRSMFAVETGRMKDGTPYQSVLRCAAEEMQRLMTEGREFDIVVDVPALNTAGYVRLHRVLPRAKWDRFDFLWLVPGYQYGILGVLVGILALFRVYRTVRWLQGRRAEAADVNR